MMYQKVLVPLDGSELAECALQHVKKMVKEGYAGQIIVLNVIDIHPSIFAEGVDANYVMKSQLTNAKKYLANLHEQFRAEGLEIKTEVLKGTAAQAIAEYAEQNGVDLIVIATHGYSGMKRLMFGSVALRVLHDSHVPVLLIRPESSRK
jgi:nucleotide-binding universal stress UspA family protein